MAIKKCKECGADISSEAIACPKCGKRNKKPTIFIVIGIILLIWGFLSGVSGLAGIHNSREQATQSSNNNVIVQKKASKTYNVGETVNIDGWQITVLGSEDRKNIGNEWQQKSTENNYIIVKLKIKNISNNPVSLLTTKSQVSSNSFSILTQSILQLRSGNKTYIADYELEDYVENEFDVFLDKINPNTTIVYNAVFETDLPTTEQYYKLMINDNDEIYLKIN